MNKPESLESKLVSILLPVYNVEEYVEASIYSLIAQTYNHIEIIICDDGSTDSTYEICKRCSEQHSCIKLTRNHNNLGIDKTLNKMFAYAKGEYILRTDGDDVSLPYRIENLMNFMEKHPEYDLVGSDVFLINDKGKHISQSNFISHWDIIKKTITLKSPILHFWLAKRIIYEKLLPYRLPSCEDYDLLLRACTQGFKFGNLKKPLYCERIRKGNTEDLYGIYQARSVRVALKMYSCRKKGNPEPMNDSEMQEYIKDVSDISAKCYRFSTQKLKLYIQNKRTARGIFNLFISLLSSSYTRKYCIKALTYRLWAAYARLVKP